MTTSGIGRRIAALRTKTIARGCTPGEAAAAEAKAEELIRKAAQEAIALALGDTALRAACSPRAS